MSSPKNIYKYMKNKHTRGNWTIGGHSQGSGENWRDIITDAEPFKGSLVATCLLKDAALIASAPDLLDALEWALNQIEDDLDPDHQAAFDAAKATIAKARGEA